MLAEANERYNNLTGRGVGQPVPAQSAVTQPATARLSQLRLSLKRLKLQFILKRTAIQLLVRRWA